MVVTLVMPLDMEAKSTGTLMDTATTEVVMVVMEAMEVMEVMVVMEDVKGTLSSNKLFDRK